VPSRQLWQEHLIARASANRKAGCVEKVPTNLQDWLAPPCGSHDLAMAEAIHPRTPPARTTVQGQFRLARICPRTPPLPADACPSSGASYRRSALRVMASLMETADRAECRCSVPYRPGNPLEKRSPNGCDATTTVKTRLKMCDLPDRREHRHPPRKRSDNPAKLRWLSREPRRTRYRRRRDLPDQQEQSFVRS